MSDCNRYRQTSSHEEDFSPDAPTSALRLASFRIEMSGRSRRQSDAAKQVGVARIGADIVEGETSCSSTRLQCP
jgi:hypothetical protein